MHQQFPTNELSQALTAESAHAAPAHILEGIPDQSVHQAVAGAPHTIYQELWHLAFWQNMTLDWISGIETPYPAATSDPFPSKTQTVAETWEGLCLRFLKDAGALRRLPAIRRAYTQSYDALPVLDIPSA